MVEDISSKLQAFNERILDNMSKQVQEMLNKSQKKNDFNIKKAPGE
jgi:hypothetical protein